MITRRKLLANTGAGVMATSLCGSLMPPLMAAETAEHPAEFEGDALLRAYMKLGGALDDRLVIWWMNGLRYGVVGADVKPLFGMKVGMFHRFFRQRDGSYQLAMFELTYYTDLDTGRLLDIFQNPYTGEVNDVMHVRLGPTIRRQTSTGQIVDRDDSTIREYWSQLGPATVQGDHIWIATDVKAHIVLPFPKAPDIRINHYTTVLGRRSEVLDPERLSVPASLAFQNILKWEPWMKMGEHAGEMMSRASGCKLEDPSELPVDYLDMARAIHPWLIKDPIETLAVQVETIKSQMS